MDQIPIISTAQQQYRRNLHNWLAQILQTLYSIQHSPDVDLNKALVAVELIGKQLPEAKRCIMFLMNTERK